MSRYLRKQPLFVVLVAILGVLASLTAASPAVADERKVYSHDYTQGFGKSGSFIMVSPSFCVRWRVGGVLHYRATVVKEYRDTTAPGVVAYAYAISRVRLTTNQVEVNTYVAKSGTCTTTRKKYSKLTIQDKLRGYSCSFNPQVTVSVPWSVGAGFWPTCGNTNLAKFSVSTTVDSSRFVMTRSEDVVTYKGSMEKGWYQSAQSGLKWSCYGANARITLQTATASNNGDTSRVAICPGWGGSRSGW